MRQPWVAGFLLLLLAPQARAELSPPKISGFIQIAGLYDQSDLSAQSSGPDKTKASFVLKRARLLFNGSLDAKTTYQLMLAGDSGSAALFDAYVERELVPSLLQMRLGQFKYPFGLEGYESGAKRPLIVLAEGTEGIAKKLGTVGGNYRDLGLQLAGRYRLPGESPMAVEYAFAVVNGSGPVANGIKDNNNDKDVIARLQLVSGQSFLIGGSFHAGQAGNQGAAFRIPERSYGLHTQARLAEAWFWAEYLSGFYKNAQGAGNDANPLGWYLLAGYRCLRDFELLLRYEDWQANRLVEAGHLRTTTLGATWQAAPFMSVKLNYLIRDAQRNASAPADGTKAAGIAIGNLLVAQFQLNF